MIRLICRTITQLRELSVKQLFARMALDREQNLALLEELTLRMGTWARLTKEQEQLLAREADKWAGGGTRRDRIATVCYCLQRAGLRHVLLDQLPGRIQRDEWYVNLKEATRAIETVAQLGAIPNKDQVFDKLERNVSLTISDVNMTYYNRIAKALVKAERYSSPLFDKLEIHVSSNLDMEYSYQTMAELLYLFAKARRGSNQFYRNLSFIIQRGHYFRHEVHTHIQSLRADGQFLKFFSGTYSWLLRQRGYQLDNSLFLFLGRLYQNPRLQFSSGSDFIQSLTNLSAFPFQNRPHIQQLLIGKALAIERWSFSQFIQLKNRLDTLEIKSKIGDALLKKSWSDVAANLAWERDYQLLLVLQFCRAEPSWGKQMAGVVSSEIMKRFYGMQKDLLRRIVEETGKGELAWDKQLLQLSRNYQLRLRSQIEQQDIPAKKGLPSSGTD